MPWTTPGTATAGSVLTASFWNEQVRDNLEMLPRVVAYATSTATTAVTTTETVAITAPTFTARAGRLYRVTYQEPGIGPAGSVLITLRVRLTNASGALYAYANNISSNGGNNTTMHCSGLTTLSAGSTVIVATAVVSSGTANRGGGLTAYLIVEDMGPS